MFEQLMDSYRKSSESWLQMQQGLFTQLTPQWPAAAPGGAGPAPEATKAFQRRWAELAIEILNKQRQSMEWLFKSGTNVIEQAFLGSEPKSPDDYRRMVDDLWRHLYEEFTAQSEEQFRDLQRWAEKSMEMGQPSPR